MDAKEELRNIMSSVLLSILQMTVGPDNQLLIREKGGEVSRMCI